MPESRVIKRCYPRLSVPSHLYTRNAYVERRLSISPAVRLSSSLNLAGIDGPGDCPSSKEEEGHALEDR